MFFPSLHKYHNFITILLYASRYASHKNAKNPAELGMHQFLFGTQLNWWAEEIVRFMNENSQ